MKKSFLLVFVIVGAVIGAGFATGREISQFFVDFGIWFIPCSCMAGFLFFILFYFLLKTGNENHFIDYSDFSKRTFGKYSKIFDFMVLFDCLVIVGSMFASVNEIQKSILPTFDFPIFSIATALFCVFVCIKGLSGLEKTNLFIIPPIIIFIIILAGKYLNLSNVFTISKGSFIPSILSACMYVCMNMMLTGVFLLIIGNKYSQKEIKKASTISGVIIGGLILVLSIIIASVIGLTNEEVPLLILSFSWNKTVGSIFCFILWFAVFSTLISAVFTGENIVSKNKIYGVVIIVFFGYLLSFMQFVYIVKILYPIMGVMGFFYLFVVILKYRKRAIYFKKPLEKK